MTKGPAPVARATTVLDLAAELTSDRALVDRVQACLRRALHYIEHCTVDAVVDLLGDRLALTPTVMDGLRSQMSRPDHVGLLLPSTVDRELLACAANTVGMRITSEMPSRVFSEELRELAEDVPVPTQLYWLHADGSDGRRHCVEAFVAQVAAPLMDEWVARGVGTHVALQVRSRDALSQVMDLLSDRAEYIPAFMHGGAMENRGSGSTVIYYDLPATANANSVRVEMHHMDSPSSP